MTAQDGRQRHYAALLEQFRDVLNAERSALIGNVCDDLIRASNAKLDVLRALASANDGSIDRGAYAPTLRELAELNLANGALVARRRRETAWTLQQLGIGEAGAAYDAQGSLGAATRRRALAQA